jgi:four helix bundle protein
VPSNHKFEDMSVWQSAAELFDRVDDFIDRAPPRLRAPFRAKLEHATLAVSQNVAAGTMRFGADALPFLDAAHAAAAEVQSMVSVALRQPYLKEFTAELGEIRKLGDSCARQLWSWANKVNSPGKPASADRGGSASAPASPAPSQYQRRAAAR